MGATLHGTCRICGKKIPALETEGPDGEPVYVLQEYCRVCSQRIDAWIHAGHTPQTPILTILVDCPPSKAADALREFGKDCPAIPAGAVMGGAGIPRILVYETDLLPEQALKRFISVLHQREANGLQTIVITSLAKNKLLRQLAQAGEAAHRKTIRFQTRSNKTPSQRKRSKKSDAPQTR